MFESSSLVWMAGGIVAVALVVARAWLRRASSESSLGTVSDHWLAEQRLNRPDSQR